MNKNLNVLLSIVVIIATPALFAFLNVTTRPALLNINTIEINLPSGRINIPKVTIYHISKTEYLPTADDGIIKNTQIYTPKDYTCMAKNIYFEARNESLKGMIAVAQVTITRVQDSRWPNTICDVVYQNKQFSWYSDGLSDHPTDHDKFAEIRLITSAILDPDMNIQDLTYGSTHYHANYVSPYWTKYMIKQAKIDSHIFYLDQVIVTASL